MGESSACLVRSFSTPADSTCYEGNPIRALGESISFGRFMTERLDWEKWSTFSNNRYVEEAEQYSKPGSVAAKKAYFEAHYKKKAAERAAAFIQEANGQANGTFESEAQQGNCTDSSFETSSNVAIIMAVNEQPDEATVNCLVIECADRDQHKCDAGQSDLDISTVEVAEDVPHPCIDTDLNVESCTVVENSNSNTDIAVPADEITVVDNSNSNTAIVVPADKITLDHSNAGEEVLALSLEEREVNSSPKLSTKTVAAKHSRSLVERKAAAAVPPRSGINSGPNAKKSVRDSVEKKRPTAQSFRMSINLPSRTGETHKRTAAAISCSRNGLYNFSTARLPAAEKKRITALSLYMSTNLPSGAGMTSKTDTAATKPRNGINFASKSMKRPTTSSLHMSINLPSGAGETSKTASVSEQNRIRKNHFNLPKDNLAALRTSSKASHGLLNQASAIPSQGRRTERPLNKSGVTANAKSSSSTSFGCLKSSSTTKSNLQPATISSPFRFRSDERAVKRKEVKTEHDKMKLRQSSGSISKLNEDKRGGSQSPSNRTRKISLTLPRSPQLGRKASSSTFQGKSLGNSWKPPISTSKRTTEKNNRTTRQSVTSLSKNTTRENASPNIQH